MNKQRTNQAGTHASTPIIPKLRLVKSGGKIESIIGANQPDEISEQVGASHPKEITPTLSETTNSEITPNHLQAIEDVRQFHEGAINATELRNRHPQTYKNWDDMKQRCRGNPKKGIPPIALDPSFEKFADFLKIVGPRPDPTWSLDRIDPTGPYSLENVRWASKTTQSRNRTNTIYLTAQGTTRPLTEWAEALGVDAGKLRSRKRSGWTDQEIIEGKRSWLENSAPLSTTTSQKHWEYTPWPLENREQMERLYQHYKWSGEHRLKFARRYSETSAARLMEEIERYSWPDYYTPSEEEIAKLNQLTRQHEIWLSIYRYNMAKWSDEFRYALYRQPELPEWVEKKLQAAVYSG